MGGLPPTSCPKAIVPKKQLSQWLHSCLSALLSPETYGRISVYAAVSGKPWNGWGGWKISFSLQIYGKQILQFSSLAMLNITGHRSSFFNVQRTLIFFFHKEGITKTQETGKSATVIEYGFKGQFFLARPKTTYVKDGWHAVSTQNWILTRTRSRSAHSSQGSKSPAPKVYSFSSSSCKARPFPCKSL